MAKSLVDDLQDVIDEVADWSIKAILGAIDQFTLNSAPFDHVEKPREVQIDEYLAIRGNAQAWYSRLEDTAQTLIGQLKEMGLPEGEIAKLSPYTIAFKVQAKYHLDMEKMLNAASE